MDGIAEQSWNSHLKTLVGLRLDQIISDLEHPGPLWAADPSFSQAQENVRNEEATQRSEVMLRGIKVSTNQFPAIHQMLRHVASQFNIVIPQAYIVGSHEFNAYSLGTRDIGIIVLNSALVEKLPTAKLLAIIGHEFGHILMEDSATRVFEKKMIESVQEDQKTEAALEIRRRNRICELVADRIGLLVCQDLEVKLQTIAAVTLQSYELAQQMNIEAWAKEQQTSVQFNVGATLNARIRTHPIFADRVLALKEFHDGKYRELMKNSISW